MPCFALCWHLICTPSSGVDNYILSQIKVYYKHTIMFDESLNNSVFPSSNMSNFYFGSSIDQSGQSEISSEAAGEAADNCTLYGSASIPTVDEAHQGALASWSPRTGATASQGGPLHQTNPDAGLCKHYVTVLADTSHAKKGKTKDSSPLRSSSCLLNSAISHSGTLDISSASGGQATSGILTHDLLLTYTLQSMRVFGLHGGLVPLPPARELASFVDTLVRSTSGAINSAELLATLVAMNDKAFTGKGTTVWRKLSLTFDGALPCDESALPLLIAPYTGMQST